MDTLFDISETLDCLTKNEQALLSLDSNMELEREALERAQESLLAHLEFLKSEYQKIEKLFSRLKYLAEKEIVYKKLLTFNSVARRPLMGYLPLFRESNVQIRKRRISKVLVSQSSA